MNEKLPSDFFTLTIANILPWPAMILGNDTKVVSINEDMRNYIGDVTHLENVNYVIGSNLIDVFPEYYNKLKIEKSGLSERDICVKTKQDDKNYFEHLWIRYVTSDCWLLIVTNETRLKELEHEYAQTSRLASMGFMLAGVCHEVSGPLAAINSMVQILQSKENISDEELHKGLDNIAWSVKSAINISNKISGFARIEEDGPSSFILDSIIDEAIQMLSQNSVGTKVKTNRTGVSDIIVYGFPNEMRRVFFNILMNSAQAMDGRGIIKINVALNKENNSKLLIDIYIQDNGSGIDHSHLPHIFEPFFTTKDAHGGTGLGLTIAHEIIEMHNGLISAGNNPGGGAFFHISLPQSLE